jgi:Pyruvate/2-oxoacid:ferredoxin oxidoreductase delta subunit
MDFTDGDIFLVYTKRITVGKNNLKKTKKKQWRVIYTIPSVKSLINCEHCSPYQLQGKSLTENSVGIF